MVRNWTTGTDESAPRRRVERVIANWFAAALAVAGAIVAMQTAFYSDNLTSVDETFPGNWLHGFLDLALLSMLAVERDYGYGLAQRLAAAGLGEVAGGTIYPALLRLERQGLALASWESSDSGPRRKYFELTETGRDSFSRLSAQWDTFARDMSLLTTAKRGQAL